MVTVNGTTGVSKVQPDTISSAEIVAGGVQPDDLAQKMTLMTAQNSTSGTAIDFTGIPSWAKRITVMFNGVSTNGASNLLVQLGDSGGIENTGYTGSATFVTNVAISSLGTTGFQIWHGVATNVSEGIMIINLSNTSKWTSSHCGGFSDQAGSFMGGGTKTLSSELTTVRITTVNGTDAFDAGSINIMYEG